VVQVDRLLGGGVEQPLVGGDGLSDLSAVGCTEFDTACVRVVAVERNR
jgi:hypothetical protein